MARTQLACVLLCLLFASSYQYGILRVEEIFSNLDTETIVIEDITIDHSTMYLDYIEDLSGQGVLVEDVLFSDGSITLPRYFTHCCGINFLSALYANGGIYADAGLNSGRLSFKVENNTGNTEILGEVHSQGGINVNDNFFVEKFTGDTTIFARILPNGGITVNDNLFTVSGSSGSIKTKESAQFLGDFYFGVSATSDRKITRLDSSALQGGATIFKGQDALQVGGDLHLCPGNGTFRGDIFVGDSNNTPLYFGRSSVADGTNGGYTVFAGQSSLNGEGGDLFFYAGDSTGVAPGGNIVLAPGKSLGHGNVGKLIIGAPNTGELNHDLIIGRPPLVSGDSADTFWAGQSTRRGVGGNTYFRAGSITSGVGVPGDVVIAPGDSVNTVEGEVLLGRPIATSLTIKRVLVSSAAGLTLFTSQTGYNGRGGDLILEAGRAGDNNVNAPAGGLGGDLYLETGSSITGESGKIVLGLATAALEFRRISTPATGQLTEITGQDSIRGPGGDLNLWAGNGHSDGGDLWLATGNGGDIFVEGGNGGTDGGEIVVRAGGSYRSNGGDIIILSGATESDNLFGGDITIEAGTGLNNGSIIYGPNINQLYINQVPIIVEDGDLLIYGGDNLLSFHTDDPESIVRWNGETVLRNKLPVYNIPNNPAGITLQNLRPQISNLHYYLEALLISVSQCGHNLLHTYDPVTGDFIEECEDSAFAIRETFNDQCATAQELVFNFDFSPLIQVSGSSVGAALSLDLGPCSFFVAPPSPLSGIPGLYAAWYTFTMPSSGIVALSFDSSLGGFVTAFTGIVITENCVTITTPNSNCEDADILGQEYSVDGSLGPFVDALIDFGTGGFPIPQCIYEAPGSQLSFAILSLVEQDFSFILSADDRHVLACSP